MREVMTKSDESNVGKQGRQNKDESIVKQLSRGISIHRIHHCFEHLHMRVVVGLV